MIDDILVVPPTVISTSWQAFKFCVPECADIIVTLQNCMSFDECGDTYSYPDLFLSRTEVIPKKNDYS